MENKKHFLTYLLNGVLKSCEANPEAKDDSSKAPFILTLVDYEPEKKNGEIKLREVEKKIKSDVEIKKTGLVTLEVRIKSYEMSGRVGISTRVLGIFNQ